MASYTVSLLQPRVIADLALARHGPRIVQRRRNNFLPLPDGRFLLTGGGQTQAQVAKFSTRHAPRATRHARRAAPARLREARLEAIADVLRALALQPPHNIADGGWRKALPELLRGAGHVLGEVDGIKGAWSHAIGGMGAITRAMAASARAAWWPTSTPSCSTSVCWTMPTFRRPRVNAWRAGAADRASSA